MVALRPFIFYKPLQPFRNGNKIEIIWEDIKRFLESCTTTNREEPTYIELTVQEAYKASENQQVAKKIVEDTKAIFGEGKSRPKTDDYPYEMHWEIDPRDLHKSVDYIIKGQPWPTFYFEPIRLYMSYWFKLVDPKTKKELKNQQYESALLIFFSGKSCCGPIISFPFSNPDENFKDYLFQIDKYLPFKLESKYLRLGKSNKKGTSNYFRKLSPD